ncbi:MAG: hypothetical protein ABH827_01410 [bacterium]
MNNIFKLVLGILIASFVICTTHAIKYPEIPNPITQSLEEINKANSYILITSLATYIPSTTQTLITNIILDSLFSIAQNYIRKINAKLNRTIHNFGSGISQKITTPRLLIKRLFFILIFGIFTITIIKSINPDTPLSFIQNLPNAILTIIGLLAGENRGMLLTPTLPSIITKEIGFNALLKKLTIPNKLDCSNFACFFMSLFPWIIIEAINKTITRPIKTIIGVNKSLDMYEQLTNNLFDKLIPTKNNN